MANKKERAAFVLDFIALLSKENIAQHQFKICASINKRKHRHMNEEQILKSKNTLKHSPHFHFHSSPSPTYLASWSQNLYHLDAVGALNERVTSKMADSCKSPWNGKCSSTNIEVYIQYKDQVLPICRHCWGEIAEKDIEW